MSQCKYINITTNSCQYWGTGGGGVLVRNMEILVKDC
jgi:hypothetical protein